MTTGTRDVIRIDGKFYDTKKLAAIHPGGELFVLLSNGTDGTALFNSSHRRAFPHDKYKDFVVAPSTVDEGSFGPAPSQKFDLYFEIAEAVKPLLKDGGFAPAHYYAKVAFILTAFIAFEAYFLVYGRTFVPSIVAGIIAAGIGLNIQHDANHGAVSRKGWINRVLGLSQDLIGGSAMNWMVSHDTIHHVHCNDTERDGDLAIPMLRLHEKVPWQMTYTVQQLYLWALEALFGVVHVFQSAQVTLAGPVGPQHVLKSYWFTHRLLLLFNAVKIAANIYMHPSWNTLGMIAVWYMAGGLYLAFFFIISHNFDGVKKITVDSHAGCFVRNQVETSSNVGGSLLAHINGGLNYQIEHHLFPRVHHSNYAKMAPTVRRICEKHGVQYVHFPTIIDNAMSTFEHLRILGTKPVA